MLDADWFLWCSPTKVALSFRLDPAFLPEEEYPVRAYGLFLVVGDGFRGFHLRFKVRLHPLVDFLCGRADLVFVRRTWLVAVSA